MAKEGSLETRSNVLVKRLKKSDIKKALSFSSMATPGGGRVNMQINWDGMAANIEIVERNNKRKIM